jgi:hypothetical protein
MCQDFAPPPLGAELDAVVDPSHTVRERFEVAHVQGSCNDCHQYIDGIGFGLGNYDAKGLYTTTETTTDGTVRTIDSSGEIGSLDNAETYLSPTGPVIAYQGLNELADLIAESRHGKACYARQWYRYSRGQRESTEDNCTVQAFGKTFKNSATASIKDLMVEFTQTTNFTLRK